MFLFEWHERYILHFTLVNQTPTELQLLGHRKKKSFGLKEELGHLNDGGMKISVNINLQKTSL